MNTIIYILTGMFLVNFLLFIVLDYKFSRRTSALEEQVLRLCKNMVWVVDKVCDSDKDKK